MSLKILNQNFLNLSMMVQPYTIMSMNFTRLSLTRTLSIVKLSPGISRLKDNLYNNNYSFAKHASIRFYALPPVQPRRNENYEKPSIQNNFPNKDWKQNTEVTQPENSQHQHQQNLPNDFKQEIVVEQKLGLFQKFKKMYKEYWYVMVPVHLVTSALWFGSFYYVSIRFVFIFNKY